MLGDLFFLLFPRTYAFVFPDKNKARMSEGLETHLNDLKSHRQKSLLQSLLVVQAERDLANIKES